MCNEHYTIKCYNILYLKMLFKDALEASVVASPASDSGGRGLHPTLQQRAAVRRRSEFEF